ncbi:MAG: trimeric intracellular cation channel family protein [Rhodospirillales bacterium]|nr:trimeric intracellular cation channel family protein [Rhodospirillales bacterium]
MEHLGLLLPVVDLTSAVVFAVTGALVASRKSLDIVGFMWLAVVTGVGGGSVRDMLLDLPVFWIETPSIVIACLVAATVVHFTWHLVESRYRLILWLDAAGMALVTIAGTAKGLDAGVGAVVAVAMGVITASVGGILRDVLGQEASVIMRREIYVTAALCGAVAYVLTLALSSDRYVAAVIGAATAFMLRVLALTLGWSLPVYRPRESSTRANGGSDR